MKKAAATRQQAPPIRRPSRAKIHSVEHVVRESKRALSALEARGAILPAEAQRVRAALDALSARVRLRIVRDQARQHASALHKQFETRVRAGLSSAKRLTAVTVEDVLTGILGRDQASITPADLAMAGRALTAAGWVQTRPRGPGGTRKRVYVGPPKLLFAEAGRGA